jgi:ergothioneine biosynthesis protein EgtB
MTQRTAAAGTAIRGHQELGERYRSVREATEALAEGVTSEDATPQSMPDASPVKWHLAHTSWFFETFVLEPQVRGYASPDPAYRVLFNSYYHGVGEQHPRPERGLVTRPGLAEVRDYRRHVDDAMAQLLARDGVAPEVASVVELGLHHEQQHQELILTDLKHLLWKNPLRPAYRRRGAEPAAPALPPLGWHAFDEGLVEIGHAGKGFGFDNEGPRHRVWLAGFELASRPVTCGEYLAFVADGGYARPEVWLSDGWAAREAQGWQAPLYWEPDPEGGPGAWRHFTLGGMRRLDAHEPVTHLSLYEADAYARWAGARLPTEFEWEAVATARPVEGHFVESGRLHPAPLAGAGASRGPQQLFGDVWEWTGSAYAPYPGYRPPAGVLGEYNGKFMCNQMVLRGGSCATPASHVRASYRNFFPPDARWQFSGIRLARDGA